MKNTFLFFPESHEDARISILGAPYDLNSSARYGSRFAPDVIRDVSFDMETNFRGMELLNLPVEDLGNVRTDNWRIFREDLKRKVGGIISKGSIPLIMGGDHSITPEIIRSMGRRDISIVALDAHLDFDESLNGNRMSHSTSRRRESEIAGAENIAVIGLRSWPTESMEKAIERGVNLVTAFDILEKGMEAVLQSLPEKGDVYLTIDIDVIDPAYAPGTGTPEPLGLTPWQVTKIIDILSPRIVGMDVVEICPPADINDVTSFLGANIMAGFIHSFFSRE